MKEDEVNKQQQQGKNSFLAREEEGQQQGAEGSSRISLQLLNAIASDRLPSLFDAKEVQELLKELNESDKALDLVRKEKAVVFSDKEYKVVFALAEVFDSFRNNKAIQEIIKNPTYNSPQWINLDLKALSKHINKTSRTREIDDLRAIIDRLSITKQVFPNMKWIDEKGRKHITTIKTPILRIKADIEDKLEDKSEAEPNEDAEKNHIIIELSRAYFMGLNNRFAIQPNNLFEVCRGGKKEIFWVLYSSVLAAHFRSWIAANQTRKRLREENAKLKNNKVSEAELRKQIKQEIEEQRIWYFPLTYESIKKKVRTNYEGKVIDETTGKKENEKQFNYRFKKDLQSVRADLIELNLITDRTKMKVKGTKGLEVVFHLNEEYYKLNAKKTLPPISGHKLLLPTDEAAAN